MSDDTTDLIVALTIAGVLFVARRHHDLLTIFHGTALSQKKGRGHRGPKEYYIGQLIIDYSGTNAKTECD